MRPPDRRQDAWNRILQRVESNHGHYVRERVILVVGAVTNGIILVIHLLEHRWASSLALTVLLVFITWLALLNSAALRRQPSPPRVFIWPNGGRRTSSGPS